MALTRFDAGSAEVSVFTFREGLLSPVAHDLELRAGDFSIEVDSAANAVSARFRAGSLRVLHAVKDGRPAPGALSERDRAEIERNLREDVLQVSKFPEIAFESTSVEPEAVRGRLTLHGAAREISLGRRSEPGAEIAEGTIDQRAFGITPFKAMLGALKVKPEVKIRVRLRRAGVLGGSA